jgi:hypothetical protein
VSPTGSVGNAANPERPDRDSLELERLALENRKLRAELDRTRPSVWDRIERLSPLLGGALAVAAFLFGVLQYVQQQERELAARNNEVAKQAAARDQEFMKPLWEREIATYFQASEAVATIATTRDEAVRRTAETEFWKLYHGPLVILETKDLSGAMQAFGNCLAKTEVCSDAEIRKRALAVSSAIQAALQEHADRRLSEFSKDKFQYHR